jgi:dihydroflavonol-4-reductase
VSFAPIDVRDVASAHLAAMTTPAAAGERFVVAIEQAGMVDIARVLDREFRPRGFKVATRRVPGFVLRLVAIWDKTAKLAVQELGKRQDVSNAKAREVLGWKPRHSLEDMVIATGNTMIQYGVVRA